jgi:hypothetical protein
MLFLLFLFGIAISETIYLKSEVYYSFGNKNTQNKTAYFYIDKWSNSTSEMWTRIHVPSFIFTNLNFNQRVAYFTLHLSFVIFSKNYYLTRIDQTLIIFNNKYESNFNLSPNDNSSLLLVLTSSIPNGIYNVTIPSIGLQI